jgi:hypothetical protein
VFDCGFSYSVSGSYTTHDYNAKSAEILSTDLKQHSKSGAILIMHMSDTSIYTAKALDIYLTEMELKKSGEMFRYASLGEVLK